MGKWGIDNNKSNFSTNFVFYQEAEPESVSKAHNVRAISTLINYLQYLDSQTLSAYTGWKSTDVFLKRYFQLGVITLSYCSYWESSSYRGL